MDYGSTLSSAKSSLRFMLRVQRRHCPGDRFAELWLADGSFGTVSDDDILVFSAEFC